MYFLRFSILLLTVLSVTNNDFRAYTLEITTIESLQMSILGFVLVVFGSFGRIWASLYIEGNKTKNLITAGPFSMVRNPLYFFSLIMLIGFSLALKAIYPPPKNFFTLFINRLPPPGVFQPYLPYLMPPPLRVSKGLFISPPR